jgi:hypothetical protein
VREVCPSLIIALRHEWWFYILSCHKSDRWEWRQIKGIWRVGRTEWIGLNSHWSLCVSLWLGAIEAQWFRLWPELEAQDQGDSPTLIAVGCHWGPVILTSARIGSPGPGRFPYAHNSWVPLKPSDSDFSQNWKPRIGEIPILFSNDTNVSFKSMNQV